MRLAQIELTLDAAPRLVVELAVAKQVVDVLAFRGDQLELDIVVDVRELAVPLCAVGPMVDVLEPVVVTGPERTHDVLCPFAFRLQLVEPADDGFDRLPAGPMFLGALGVALAPASVREPEHTDDPRQRQALC